LLGLLLMSLAMPMGRTLFHGIELGSLRALSASILFASGLCGSVTFGDYFVQVSGNTKYQP